MPILEQLHLEEALLRADDRNWLICNVGSPASIVLGISGAPEELIDTQQWEQTPIPVIRRFSGGGSVVVDEDTLFVTLLCNRDVLSVMPFPSHILTWMSLQYHPLFGVKENDFVLGHKKCGGNALYIQRERWLLHTTFLWDYHPDKMRLLNMPARQPLYREGRSHDDFLCRLRNTLATRETLYDTLYGNLSAHFILRDASWQDAQNALRRPHRRSTEALQFRTSYSNLQSYNP